MEKTKKPHKGEHRYITVRKKTQLLMTFVYVLIGILIFLIGLLLNKNDYSNIFTILAIIMVIPAAKRFVNFIVFFSFKSVDEELYRKASLIKKEGDIFYTDVVFTSPEKIMYLSFLTIAGSDVIGLLGNKNQDEAYIEKYLREGILKRSLDYSLIITKNPEEFLRKYKKADRSIDISEESREEIASFLYSIIVE